MVDQRNHSHTLLARHQLQQQKWLNRAHLGIIKAKSQQSFALDLLLDPTVALVTLV